MGGRGHGWGEGLERNPWMGTMDRRGVKGHGGVLSVM